MGLVKNFLAAVLFTSQLGVTRILRNTKNDDLRRRILGGKL
jgi:hypothetical protein